MERLLTAKYLTATPRFNGTVHFIFQSSEEGLGGAQAMPRDGLFERFPCDWIYGFQNRPGLPIGRFLTRPAAGLAGGAFFDLTITGKGAHGAHGE